MCDLESTSFSSLWSSCCSSVAGADGGGESVSSTKALATAWSEEDRAKEGNKNLTGARGGGGGRGRGRGNGSSERGADVKAVEEAEIEGETKAVAKDPSKLLNCRVAAPGEQEVRHEVNN